MQLEIQETKLNYDVQAAIQERGTTFDSGQYAPGPLVEIDFRISIDLNGKPTWNIPNWALALGGESYRRDITKTDWKSIWSGYRKYISQSNQVQCELPHPSGYLE